ncbi:isocitrate lyase/PEP mutase family protein [Demequina mangrovi]|uniref:2-Methylisocitrate lyase, PEP mutase family n=1 Tax=Demequina mangrovi TaxID=1043493 RepID=A0A1H6W6E8_9MICO|nr:isocitrate lyase/phosphoenolpyruvate mutase family protein [Demequina mangrovi]SEJ12473.1 2-Methylisocitrate lyase, PEP mutase family [Demequina mangrovi]
MTVNTADLFRALHRADAPLALPNAWDAASAALMEEAGAPAIATTSAGIAWSLGLPDGDTLSREEAVAALGRIVAAVAVPVTADIEGGYGETPAEVADTATAVIDTGAVGINIEDGQRSPEDLAARIGAARRAADRAGVALFINARTDVYLRGLAPEADCTAETIARARVYLDAGADGVFVPGPTEPEAIRALAAGIDAPLNVMAGPGAPSVAELGALGAARVSLGVGIAEAAYAVARRAAGELLATGTYGSLTGGVDYAAMNTLLAVRASGT